MPPIARPKASAAPKGGANSDSSAGTGAGSRPQSPREKGPASSTSPKTAAPKGRTTQRQLLKDRIMRMYVMAGTMLRPFGRFYPAAEPIGDNLKLFGEDAADAWMELADSDPKIKAYLESLTGASVWGNVIGIHVAIFSAAIPAGGALGSFMGAPDSDDPVAMAMKMGLSREDAEQAVAMATKMADGIVTGPGDTVRSQRSPAEAPVPRPVPKPGLGPQGTSGIPSPEVMGVQNGGQEHSNAIPADGGPVGG